MPYGHGHSRRELKQAAAEVASRETGTFVVKDAKGRPAYAAGTREDAEILAKKVDGASIHKKK